MIQLEAVDGRIQITTDQPFRDRDRIKLIPGARYSQTEDRWWAPLTWASCMSLRGVFGVELVLGQSIYDWATRERAERIDPAMALRHAMDAEGDPDLYPFQRAGVRFMAYVKGALLCDEMGTGKTVQMVRTWMELMRRGENPFPAIVVCPNNMVYTWKKECEKWWPGLRVGVVKGDVKTKVAVVEDVENHVTVINFEGVRGLSRLAPYGGVRLKRCVVCDGSLADIPANSQSRCEHCLKPLNHRAWRTVVIDEAHKMKDPRSKQTRACWALRTDATAFRFTLTGTAIADAPHDLWPALHFVSPEEFPSRSRYLDRYCLMSFNLFGGTSVVGLKPETKDEFFAIVDPRMRRMPKELVLPFLPKKTYSERFVEMTPKQKKAYDQMQDGMISDLGGVATVASNPLVQLTRLGQFASAFAEVDENGDVKLAMPSNKVDALIEVLDEMGDAPAVVFAQSRQLIELAAHKLETLKISHTMIIGGQTAEEREISKEMFQQGQRRVILCTISAGGISITLTRAATAIFMQRSWSMIDNSQAEDRVHRIGSEVHDKIEIIDLISMGTSEEAQREVLSGKAERLEEIMRDRDTVRKLMTGDAF